MSGATLRIPVTVKGIPKPNITWGKEDSLLKPSGRINLDIGDKTTTMTIKKVAREDDGLYYVIAENEVGEARVKFDVEIIGMSHCQNISDL